MSLKDEWTEDVEKSPNPQYGFVRDDRIFPIPYTEVPTYIDYFLKIICRNPNENGISSKSLEHENRAFENNEK